MLRCLRLAAAVAVLTVPTVAQAHFIWLSTVPDAASQGEPGQGKSGQVKVRAVFGEGPLYEEADYLDRIAHAEAWLCQPGQKPAVVELKQGTDGDLPCLLGRCAATAGSTVELRCRYGVFSRGDKAMLLHYFARTAPVAKPEDLSNLGPSTHGLLDVAPSYADGRLKLVVSWQKKPLADASVSVETSDGASHTLTTDKEGRVDAPLTGGGWYAVRAGHVLPEAGNHDGKAYQEIRHYSTLAFALPGEPAKSAAAGKSAAHHGGEKPAAKPAAGKPAAMLPELPEAVTSFGAATAGRYLYVYGGHIGTAHDHSKANLSDKFCRLNLDEPKAWESLPMGQKLQGLAAVAHNGKFYRVGGLDARNEAEADADLHSVAEVSIFDPETKKWLPGPALPQPRSSHDAVVLGDVLYVVGGWNLKGASGTAEWCDDVLALDLNAEQLAWKTISQTPFRRRALGVGGADGRLVAVGGITEEGTLSREVDLFDVASGKWSKGPELPVGENKGNGFGVAVNSIDGQILASGMNGQVYRLAPDAGSWQPLFQLATARFFHRLLPVSPRRVAFLGGAEWGSGHVSTVEVHDLPPVK